MNWGGQFENLLRFLEMGTATTPPPPAPSQVTNDQPLKKTNRILHNLAAFYHYLYLVGSIQKQNKLKPVTTTA